MVVTSKRFVNVCRYCGCLWRMAKVKLAASVTSVVLAPLYYDTNQLIDLGLFWQDIDNTYFYIIFKKY